MKKIALMSLILGLSPLMSMAQTDPQLVVTVDNQSFVQSSSAITGFFDVYVDINPASPPGGLASYIAVVDERAGDPTGLTFGTPTRTDVAPSIREQLLSSGGTIATPAGGQTNSATHATIQADLPQNQSQSFVDNAGLLRVPFTIAPNSVGVFHLDIDPDMFTGTNFSNATATGAVPFTVSNGTITVTPAPEPASATLLLGAMAGLVLRRARRTN